MPASTSIESRTISDRSEPTSRSASLTVALIVVVPSCDRAASSATSSMSTSRLVMGGVYTKVTWIYTYIRANTVSVAARTQHFTQQVGLRVSHEVSADAATLELILL